VGQSQHTSGLESRRAAEKSVSAFLSARVAEANGQIPQAARDFAYSMAVPHATEAFRIPQVFTATPSALAQPWSVDEQDWTLAKEITTDVRGLPDGEMMVAISRSPIYSRVQYAPNPDNETYIGWLRFAPHPAYYGPPTANYGGLVSGGFQNRSLIFADEAAGGFHLGAPEIDINLTGLQTDPAQPYQPHGPFLYAASHLGKRCFYVPAAGSGDVSRVSWVFESVNANGDLVPVTSNVRLVVHLYLLSGEEWVTGNAWEVDMGSGANTATLNTFPAALINPGIGPGNYVAFSVEANISGAGQLATISYGGEWLCDQPTFAHLPIPGLYEKMTAVGSIRPVAASVMLSPNSASYQKQGLVRGVQLPPGESWTTVMRGGFNSLNSAEGVWNDTWEHGIYGFLKPTGVAEFEMVNPFKLSAQAGQNNLIVDVEYPLFQPGSWLVVMAKVDLQSLSGAGANYAAGASYTTVLRTVEFRTLDPWFKQDLPTLDQSELELAMRLLTHMPQFHQNFGHIAGILSFLRGAVALGKNLVPKMLAAFAPTAIKTVAGHFSKQHPEHAHKVQRMVEAVHPAPSKRQSKAAHRMPDPPPQQRRSPSVTATPRKPSRVTVMVKAPGKKKKK
jgi:hypothetical protein